MKIKAKDASYQEVLAMPPYQNKRPQPQGRFWRWLLKTVSAGELKQVGFSCRKKGMEKLAAGEPALYLMNHSSFIDLKIAATLIYPRPFHIVCTLDGFVGKEGLMRKIGCIPTRKFMTDTALVRDMMHVTGKLKESILLYPEASYTFDGTATPLPESLGKALKMLKVPVVMIRTYGAFSRDPLYNGLRLRDVKVSADMEYLLSPQEIREKTVAELNAILKERFTFDHFRWQQENGIRIAEDFRAEGLERVLYKCPFCGSEGSMSGHGTELTCHSCGREWELTELGTMQVKSAPERVTSDGAGAPEHLDGDRSGAPEHLDGDRSGEPTAGQPCAGQSRAEQPPAEFAFVPDWYVWERAEVRREIENGSYEIEFDCDIIALVNTDAAYRIGEGHLRHDGTGFHLTGCNGELDYRQEPEASYSLYSDYFWYEIGDMVSIGTPRIQYYCFPKEKGTNVAKMRLAAEELYKQTRKNGAAPTC